MMHLLVAAHDCYPDPGSGGTGRYVYETGRRLVDRGHEVSVVTRRRGDVPQRETIAGMNVYRYDLTIAEHTAREIWPQIPEAYRTVSDHLDAIHANSPPDHLSFQGPVTSTLVDLAAASEIPRSVTFHSPWPTEYRIRTRSDSSLSEPRRRFNAWLRHRLERRALTRAEQAITLSEYMADRLRETYDLDGTPASNPTVVPGGVDVDQFSPDAGSYEKIDCDGTAFLTVRRLSPRMGHDLLLDAFARVVAVRPDARLYIGGDGPLRQDLEQKTEKLGLDEQVTFLGYVPDVDLPGAYATADVFVLPTIALEGFGLATLEALASGTPVVATPVGGTVEVLDGLDGDLPEPALVPSMTVAGLARRMLDWANLTEHERRNGGLTCRNYVEDEYTWSQTTSELERICEG